jgi:hypothetical protein
MAAPRVEVESALPAVQSVPVEFLPNLLETLASRMRPHQGVLSSAVRRSAS